VLQVYLCAVVSAHACLWSFDSAKNVSIALPQLIFEAQFPLSFVSILFELRILSDIVSCEFL